MLLNHIQCPNGLSIFLSYFSRNFPMFFSNSRIAFVQFLSCDNVTENFQFFVSAETPCFSCPCRAKPSERSRSNSAQHESMLMLLFFTERFCFSPKDSNKTHPSGACPKGCAVCGIRAVTACGRPAWGGPPYRRRSASRSSSPGWCTAGSGRPSGRRGRCRRRCRWR